MLKLLFLHLVVGISFTYLLKVQTGSVGGIAKAPWLATAVDSELVSSSNWGADGLMQSPLPACPSLDCFPLGCEMGKVECHPVGVGRERVQ